MFFSRQELKQMERIKTTDNILLLRKYDEVKPNKNLIC